MMRYPGIHIIFLVGFIIMLFCGFYHSFCFLIMSGWFFAGLILLVRGSSRVCSGMYVKAYCMADTSEKIVALTFDDGPHPVHTPLVLDILKEKNIRAAFFVKGRAAAMHPEILKRIDEEGHILGNHSWSHSFWFDFFSFRRMRKDLETTNILIEEITGRIPRFFRPPYGVTNPPLARAIMETGMITIGWNIRSLDTLKGDPEKILSRISSSLSPGSIILMHDNLPAGNVILGRVIDEVKKNGYTFVRADKLLNMEAYDRN